MINKISLWFIRKELILTLVVYANGGIVLPLFIGAHILKLKIIKQIALVQKSETNLPFTNKGGIAGIF